MSNYAGLDDDEDSGIEDINLDADDDQYNIKINDKFTKNQSKQEKKNQNRGHIMISLHEESPSPTEERFDGFDVDDNNKTNITNKKNNKNDGVNAQFIISNNNNNDNININDDNQNIKQKKKKKKKKKRKYKGDDIDMMPLSAQTNDPINSNDIGNNNNNDNMAGENDKNDDDKKIKSKKRKRKKKRKKKLTRNQKIKKYIGKEVKWWLFLGVELSLFIFCYACINVGIAEDLLLFYHEYNELVCNYTDDTGTDNTQKSIGDILTHTKLQQFFTSSLGCCIISLFGLIIGLLLICLKEYAMNARKSLLVSISYILICILGTTLLFIWNCIVTVDIINELHIFLTGITHCDNDTNDDAINEAHRLNQEFEVMAVLILPMLFVIATSVCYIKIKVC